MGCTLCFSSNSDTSVFPPCSNRSLYSEVFLQNFFCWTNCYTKCSTSYYVYSFFWTTMRFLWNPCWCIKRYRTFLIPGYCHNYRNLLLSYSLDTYYFQAALPVKYSVLCFSYFMDTNTISYYNWLCYNKPNKVISKRINIIMHKSDSFENLAVRSTLNNILVLPASLSHNIGFRYRPRAQEVTVE